MSKEKQIEEMAEITSRDCGNCNNCKYVGMKGDGVDCIDYFFANTLYNAGYRKQEWISVNDRLPTDERDVLAYYGFDRGDGDLGMMFIGVLSYFVHDPKPHFQHEGSGLRVTHWMPLPEPPKGE